SPLIAELSRPFAPSLLHKTRSSSNLISMPNTPHTSIPLKNNSPPPLDSVHFLFSFLRCKP
ncbi:hypothetical protein SK128_010971, partial [Halocaridina rubra]